MAETRKRLGRGLDSLISPTRIQELATASADAAVAPAADIARHRHYDYVTELPLEKIHRNPHQPRQNWDEKKLLDLADSIKANGLIQPVLVRQMGEGYQLIAGERRFRAMQMAGRAGIPAVVRQASEEQMVEWALVENIHRTDLNALERARAYQHYLEAFSLTAQQAAEKLGEDRSTVANYIRLLELPNEIQQMVTEGLLSMGHARALLGVPDKRRQLELAQLAIGQGFSVRELERRIQAAQRPDPASSSNGPEKSPHIQELEREWTRTLGTKVTIKPRGQKGHRGCIVIDFYSLDDFDRIRERLC